MILFLSFTTQAALYYSDMLEQHSTDTCIMMHTWKLLLNMTPSSDWKFDVPQWFVLAHSGTIMIDPVPSEATSSDQSKHRKTIILECLFFRFAWRTRDQDNKKCDCDTLGKRKTAHPPWVFKKKTLACLNGLKQGARPATGCISALRESLLWHTARRFVILDSLLESRGQRKG